MTGPRSGRGVYPCPGMGYSPTRSDQGCTLPIQGWSTPIARSGWGVPHPTRDRVSPPPWNRTADRVLDTQQSVCLLHSGRRTFLFEICLILKSIGSICKQCIGFYLKVYHDKLVMLPILLLALVYLLHTLQLVTRAIRLLLPR